MNATLPETSSVLVIRQAMRATFSALTSQRAALILVRQGQKVVSDGEISVEIKTGRIGVLPARVSLMIENRPDASGDYVASILVPSPDVIANAKRDGLENGNPFGTTRDDRTVAAFERAIGLIDDPLTPVQVQDNAVREVLLWLGTDGIGFGTERPVSFSDQLRGILSGSPDTAWRSATAAKMMAVSEATLRRRLAANQTSFKEVLADVRMAHALGMLQTTDFPINRIAMDCGYASASRFSTRFRARFGMAPSDIRGDGPDRNSTAFDRKRRAARAASE